MSQTFKYKIFPAIKRIKKILVRLKKYKTYKKKKNLDFLFLNLTRFIKARDRFAVRT